MYNVYWYNIKEGKAAKRISEHDSLINAKIGCLKEFLKQPENSYFIDWCRDIGGWPFEIEKRSINLWS